MTATDAMHASVTFLTYGQLTRALYSSTLEYERRFGVFLLTSSRAISTAASDPGSAASDEARAAMASDWAACQAQSAMTRAITDELSGRIERGDYA